MDSSRLGIERTVGDLLEEDQEFVESGKKLSISFKGDSSRSFQVRLIDAGFIWTEPHSRRIKLKLTVQKEVIGGAVLQQVFPVEFVVLPQMCDECRRIEAKDYWRAVVQVRQKVCDFS